MSLKEAVTESISYWPAVVVFVVIVCTIGYRMTGGGLISDTEGSDENGDVKHSDNPALFDSATRRARPGNDY